MNRSTLRIFVICLLAFACSIQAVAQSAGTATEKKTKESSAARRKTTARGKAKKPQPVLPCKSGDFIVKVDPNATGSFTVPICIAQHSPVLIEFPASDPFYAHHPGDENFVTLDKRSKNTDPLVIRPGDGFFVEPGRVRPSSVVSVQMTSGLIGSFPVYAVDDVSLNNNHIVVSYDRAEVVAARRRLGLRADLVPAELLAPYLAQPESEQATTISAVTPQPTPQPAPRFIPRTDTLALSAPAQSPPVQSQSSVIASSALTAQPRSTPPKVVTSQPAVALVPDRPPANSTPENDAAALERATRAELLRVSSARQPLKFGSSLHGLALAVSHSRFVIAGYRIEVVAVRNTLTEPLRLVPGQPEIYIETMNKGRPINAPRLKPHYTLSTLKDSEMLAPGETYYFAFAFAEPVLGVNDFLRVAVAQTNAADEPVFSNLITAAR